MKISNKIIVLVLSLFVVASLSLSLGADTNFIFSQSNSFIWIILLVFFYILLIYAFKLREKRLIFCSLFLAMLLATFEMLGYILDTYLDFNSILFSKMNFVKFIVKWLGYCILFYSCIALFYDYLNKLQKNPTTRIYPLFIANKKSFFICWAIIFCAYIPYFLTYFPGIVTSDSISQIDQTVGISTLNNHHPVLHTLFIGLTMKIGVLLGNYNLGVAIYSIIQMLLMSAMFSFLIYYMGKKNVPIIIRFFTLLFYALYPVHSLYSITMWKDIPFALIFLLFIILLTEIATNNEKFFKSKLKIISSIIIFIMLILLRNNGLYVFILTAPFILLTNRRYYKYLISIFFIVIGFYIIWKGVIFNCFNIKDGSIREALSIPLQQFARIYCNKGDLLTENERESIHKFIPVENIAELYNPTISDPIKFSADDLAISKNKKEFIYLWFKLAYKYPIETLEAFLCNSYGYWYPEASHWVASREIYQSQYESEQALNLHQTPIIEGKIIKKIDSLTERRDLPILSMFFSLGFAFWIVLLLYIYTIYQKNYNLTITYMPILFLWLTNLASPVFCEFRYMYSLFACLPILISNIGLIKNIKGGKKWIK